MPVRGYSRAGRHDEAPASIGQKTQPATDRCAFKAAEGVRTSPPVHAGGFLPRIVLMPDFDYASRAQGEWSDPAGVVHHAGPPLASDYECPDDER